jgi:hypothetical protein
MLLSPSALRAVVVEFVTRDGTDDSSGERAEGEKNVSDSPMARTAPHAALANPVQHGCGYRDMAVSGWARQRR